MQNQNNNQTNLGNVSTSPQNDKKEPMKKCRKYSILSIIMAIILLIVVIMLGERLIFDANRFLNPVIEQEYTSWKNSPDHGSSYSQEAPQVFSPSKGMEMAVDTASGPISSTRVYYPRSEESRYTMYKLIIHAAIIIPFFLLVFAFYYFKKENNLWKPILVSLVLAGFWLIFHLLGETASFVMDAYKNIAIYIILIILAALFGGLAFYAQKKHVFDGK